MKQTSTKGWVPFKKCLVLIFTLTGLLMSQTVSAHRVELYTTTGCSAGQNVTIDAVITNAPSYTWYSWQYKDASGLWRCFINGTNSINGVNFTVSGAKGTGANNAPLLTIANATSALEDVQIRVLMRENAEPCGAPAGTTWGGDDLGLEEVKVLRLHIYSPASDCGGNTPGCIGNVLFDANGYYGGFESKVYNSATATFTDNNFIAGAGSTQYTISQPTAVLPTTSGTGTAQIWNNPYTMNIANGKFAPHTGNFQMIVHGTASTQRKVWYKTVTVNPGATYAFSVWVARTQGNNAFNLKLTANGVDLISGAVSTTIGAWNQVNASYTVPAGVTSMEISISDVSTNASRYFSIDDICFRQTSLSLGNRVWYDTDNDGINDAAENGIANVIVNLYKDDNNDNVADGAPIASTTTNSTGYYMFSTLTAGNYIVGVVTPNGYMRSTVNGADPDNNTDLDNNGVLASGNETRGLAITLSSGAEPGGNANNTYDFGFLPDCNCTNNSANQLVNASFENGTTGWTWSGGTLTTGTGFIACGAKNGFNNWSSGTSKVYQDVTVVPGATVTFSGFAGVHTAGLACSPTLSLIFLNAAGTVIGQSNVAVTRDVDVNFSQLEYYTISTTVPTGAAKVRVQSSITCDVMKIDAFCLISSIPCASCQLGYPDNSNLPKSAVVFNENEVLRAMDPSSVTCGVLESGYIKLWYSDEHAMTLGVRSVIVKRANGTTYTTNYPITAYGGSPTCASGVQFGTLINSGAQTGNDVADGGGRPLRPVMYITDLTVNGPTSRIGDWQQGGLPYNPTIICGTWKGAVRTVDSTQTPPKITITPDADPTANGWNLGGGEAPPAGTSGEAYGTLVKWDINTLGLIPGHSYRIQLMVHDGDQNKVGGDVGSMCTTIYIPALGSIGDRVWKDDNANGIQDAGEVGIAGVTLTLLNNSAQPIATTTTDAFGNYKFSNLAAGSYSVRINPPANYSISPQTQGTDVNLDSDFGLVSSTTGTVTLTTGQNRTDIDCGLNFKQNTTASVGDRVWLDTNADGVQDAGEPGVSNVLVTLYNNSGTAVRYTYTDVNGLYLFTDVTPGSYTVGMTLPPAFVFTTNTGAVSVTNNSDIIAATGRTATFTVNAGDQITYVDGGIKNQVSTNASVGDYVWNDLNKNGIQEAGEPGIPGVSIRLVNSVTNVIVAMTTTDVNGYYIFNDVTPASYLVDFITPAGYTTTTKLGTDPLNLNTDSDVDPLTARTASFTVGAGQRITFVDAGYWLTVAGTAKLGDRVWLDANQNGIQDAGEKSVGGMTVTLYDGVGTAIKSVVTNTNGNYLFTDLAAGNYSVGFSNVPVGYTFTTPGQGTAATGSDANPTTGRTATVTLVAGQVNLDVDAGIRSSMAGTGSIGNKVWYDLNNNGLQEANEPGVLGATVELLDGSGNPVDKDPATPGVQPSVTATNALGEYLFTGLAAGDYKVKFSALPAGYVVVAKGAGTDRNLDSDGNPLATGASTTDVLGLAAGEERLDMDLGIFNPTAPLGQIGDFVWFDSNNNGIQDAGEQGVPGVTVTLLNSNNAAVVATTVTDGNGMYRFVNLADGSYAVKFSNLPAGFGFSANDLGGNDGLDSDPNPLNGVTGTYVISGGNTNLTVDAGIYSTRAALGDYVWFDANSDGIQDATEKGIPGITVILYDAANTAVNSAITDEKGRYFFSNLNPGAYTVGFSTIPTKMGFTLKDVVAAGDAADSDVDPATGKTGSYTLAAGQVNLTVDAGLKPFIPASVGDFVWYDLNRDGIQDAGEPGVPGVVATLYNSSGQVIGSAVTDGNGYYLISNVPAASGYYVVFSNRPDLTAPWTLQNVGGAAANNNSKADASGQTTAFNVADGQDVTNIDAGVFKIFNLSGNVWHDVNGMNDNLVNNTGPLMVPPAAPIPTGLRITMVDANTGLVLRSTLVAGNGAFNFTNVAPGNYTLILSPLPGTPGQPSPFASLPTGWINTGEHLGLTPGRDAVINGKLTVSLTTFNITNANFGIQLNNDDIGIN